MTITPNCITDQKGRQICNLSKQATNDARHVRAFLRLRQICLSESVGDRNLFCHAEAFLP